MPRKHTLHGDAAGVRPTSRPTAVSTGPGGSVTVSDGGCPGRTRAEPPFWTAVSILALINSSRQIWSFCVTRSVPTLLTGVSKLKALVAVARSILVIIWHLLSDPVAHFRELGPACHASRTDTQRKARGHIRQLEALGYTVTLTQPA
jgi:hypothetical protein